MVDASPYIKDQSCPHTPDRPLFHTHTTTTTSGLAAPLGAGLPATITTQRLEIKLVAVVVVGLEALDSFDISLIDPFLPVRVYRTRCWMKAAPAAKRRKPFSINSDTHLAN